VDSEEDRGSTPLASTFIGKSSCQKRQLTTGMTTHPISFAVVRQGRN
jgi:hypothetical protein